MNDAPEFQASKGTNEQQLRIPYHLRHHGSCLSSFDTYCKQHAETRAWHWSFGNMVEKQLNGRIVSLVMGERLGSGAGSEHEIRVNLDPAPTASTAVSGHFVRYPGWEI